MTRPAVWGMALEDPWGYSPLSRNLFACTAVSSKIQQKVVRFTRTIVTTSAECWRIPFCFVLLQRSIFLALLSRSLPAVTSIQVHKESPPPPLLILFSYSKAVEGCNRTSMLRRWYCVHNPGFHFVVYGCVPIDVQREQPTQSTKPSLHA